MKILALSDLHGDAAHAKKMAEEAAKNQVDLVVIAGDIVGEDNNVEGIVGEFRKKGLEVGVIPGNHEGMAEINFLVEKYGAKNLHGYVWKKGDVGIFGCGYGDVGVHQLNDEDFFKTLKKTHDSLAGVKKKIMLTHTQPEGSIIGLGMFPGSKGIRKAIDELQPDLHLCGHIHESAGIEEVIGKTRVVNVGRSGRIFEL